MVNTFLTTTLISEFKFSFTSLGQYFAYRATSKEAINTVPKFETLNETE